MTHESGHDHAAATSVNAPAIASAAVPRSPVRRRAILAGALGAAAGAFVGATRPVGATVGGGDQGALQLGSNDEFRAPNIFSNTANVSSVATVIKASPNYANFAAFGGPYILRADATPSGTTTDVNGLEGLAASGGSGVVGISPTGFGVEATGRIAVYARGVDDGVLGISDAAGTGVLGLSSSGTGVIGLSGAGIGGAFQGRRAAIVLTPQDAAGAPSSGNHLRGELLVDLEGTLFLCTSAGTPGTWAQLSGVRVPPSFRTLPTPERFVDTRTGLGGVQGPVPAGTTSTFRMTARDGESRNAALQIPDDATILVGNLSVIGGANVPVGSFVTLWPSGDRPATSSISFGPGAIVANSCTVGLATVDGHGTLRVFAQQQCDYVIDVVGYYA